MTRARAQVCPGACYWRRGKFLQLYDIQGSWKAYAGSVEQVEAAVLEVIERVEVSYLETTIL